MVILGCGLELVPVVALIAWWRKRAASRRAC